MNRELVDRWTTALEGGEFEQGTRYLKREEPESGTSRHCCLGVLVEVALRGGELAGEWRRKEDEPGIWEFVLLETGVGYEAGLPRGLSEMAGLVGGLGERGDRDFWIVEGWTGMGALSAINDVAGVGFSGIARILREQLLEGDGDE